MLCLHCCLTTFDRRTAEANFRYYEPRCGHGSSLSQALHAVVAARLGQIELATRYFHATAEHRSRSDHRSHRGRHPHCCARRALAGGYFGLCWFECWGGRTSAAALLPAHWRSMSFRVRWRGRRLHIRICQKSGGRHRTAGGRRATGTARRRRAAHDRRPRARAVYLACGGRRNAKGSGVGGEVSTTRYSSSLSIPSGFGQAAASSTRGGTTELPSGHCQKYPKLVFLVW